MQRGNQRLPMLSIQNKNENSSSNKMKSKTIDQNNESKHNFGNIKPFGDKTVGRDETSEKQLADGEFLKNVQKALQTAINENEELRDKVKLLLEENSELKDDIENKNFALVELAQFYEFCQKNHKPENQEESSTEIAKKAKNKRKSKSL